MNDTELQVLRSEGSFSLLSSIKGNCYDSGGFLLLFYISYLVVFV